MRKRWVQYTILAAVLIVGFFAIGNSLFSAEAKPEIGAEAPAFKLQGLDGKVYNLSDYKGKYVVVNFWGTFCPPCVKELPAIQKKYGEWIDKAPIEVLGINIGEDRATVSGFLKQFEQDGQPITYPILFDKGKLTERKYKLISYPTTFFINKQGKIVDMLQGEMTEQIIDNKLNHLVSSS